MEGHKGDETPLLKRGSTALYTIPEPRPSARGRLRKAAEMSPRTARFLAAFMRNMRRSARRTTSATPSLVLRLAAPQLKVLYQAQSDKRFEMMLDRRARKNEIRAILTPEQRIEMDKFQAYRQGFNQGRKRSRGMGDFDMDRDF